jgi:hypothetical protein
VEAAVVSTVLSVELLVELWTPDISILLFVLQEDDGLLLNIGVGCDESIIFLSDKDIEPYLGCFSFLL